MVFSFLPAYYPFPDSIGNKSLSLNALRSQKFRSKKGTEGGIYLYRLSKNPPLIWEACGCPGEGKISAA
jgi:hypothetical protein